MTFITIIVLLSSLIVLLLIFNEGLPIPSKLLSNDNLILIFVLVKKYFSMDLKFRLMFHSNIRFAISRINRGEISSKLLF